MVDDSGRELYRVSHLEHSLLAGIVRFMYCKDLNEVLEYPKDGWESIKRFFIKGLIENGTRRLSTAIVELGCHRLVIGDLK